MRKFVAILILLAILLSTFSSCAKGNNKSTEELTEEAKQEETDTQKIQPNLNKEPEKPKEPEEIHTFATEYSFDRTFHWYACNDCEELYQKEAHTLNKDGVCSVCNHSEIEMLYNEYGAKSEQVLTYMQKLEEYVNLSTIHVTTKDNSEILSRETYVDCIVELFNCDEKYVISSAEAGIRVRGNATAYQGDVEQIRKNQVPYRIKFDKKQNMLGLNDGSKFKSWVLLKPEELLVADYMAFKLAKAVLSKDTYCSDCDFVQVYINQEYKGLYLLAEQNQVNKNRIEISEVPENYTGTDIGYLLEIDHYAEPSYFKMEHEQAIFTDIVGTTRLLAYQYYSVKNDTYSQEQLDFIEKYMKNCFKIVLEATKGNYLEFDKNYDLIPAKYNNSYDTINAVMDIESVVNMYLLDEIICDRDCGTGSFYMCIDFSSGSKFDKLTFTAPWDSGWGYTLSYSDYFSGVFQDIEFSLKYGDRSNAWYIVLASQDWFIDLVKERWQEIYRMGRIDNIVNNVYWYIEENEIELNRQYPTAVDKGKEIVEWVRKRIAWMNSVLGAK